MTALDWDARSYDRISDMQLESGREFLATVPLRGDELAVDAGCGTGRVTRLLIDRLPRGRVIGVDASPSMVERARDNLDGVAEVVLGDLLEFEPPEPVDVVFSTATFHWIADHDRLFRSIHGWLRPGGLLAAQLGGKGNAHDMVEATVVVAGAKPFAPHLRGVERPWNFPTPEEASERLRRAGFDKVRCERTERRFEFDDPREFARTVGLAVHLDRLPEELREPFLDTVIAETADPSTVHLIRTNIHARRPPAGADEG